MPAVLIFIFATILGIVLLLRRIGKSQAVGRSLRSLGPRIAAAVLIGILLLKGFGGIVLVFYIGLEPRTRPMMTSEHILTIVASSVYGLLLYCTTRIIPTYPEETGILDD